MSPLGPGISQEYKPVAHYEPTTTSGAIKARTGEIKMEEIKIEKSPDGYEVYHYENGNLIDHMTVEKITMEIEK
jgi:hypothetical protein